MCRDFYRDRQDKSRLSRQIKIFEIFEGNRDFFETNRDFFSHDRDILDFRHLWKVVGEGFTLTFLNLPWASPDHLPQISTIKVNIAIEICEKSSYFSIEIETKIEKSTKITNVSISIEKSRSRPKSTADV
jgi:hypothetical protein